MSKAEERALEAYPNEHFVDHTYAEMCRGFYEEGYEQAEKDLQWEVNHTEEAYQNGYVAGLKERLTWEDVKRIVEIADRLCPYTTKEMAEFEHEFRTEEAYYREILKRFYNGKC